MDIKDSQSSPTCSIIVSHLFLFEGSINTFCQICSSALKQLKIFELKDCSVDIPVIVRLK